jgi:hypothetical protein|tara:strand:+ start:246 stop:470 length:225 start_codon:yes stop_codon:yes gene_type:complete
MNISKYVGDYFNVKITVEIRNKKSNELIDIYSKTLKEDSESSLVIHDRKNDLRGFMVTHFSKIKLGLPGGEEDE